MTWIVFIKDGSENNITGKGDQFINFKKRLGHCTFKGFALQVVKSELHCFCFGGCGCCCVGER